MEDDQTETSNEDLYVDLHSYLQDSTFVEYLNSFLMLPAFSNRLFYNEDTGYFEQVHNQNIMYGGGNITPSSSLSTLYLPEEAIGASLDKEQSWQWVTQHRLPLFVKSDLYSEYKVSKLLTARDSISRAWSGSVEQCDVEDESLELSILNLIEVCHKRSASSIELQAPRLPGIMGSQSDAELETNLPHRRKVTWHESLFTTPDVTGVPRSRPRSNSYFCEGRDSLRHVPSVSTPAFSKVTWRDHILSTKSGMNSLWKFLKGKAGEKNLLFWLDAERIKYCNSEAEQQRLVKEIRERYFYSGSVLKLSAEIVAKLGRHDQLGMQQIEALQDAMMSKLKEYWCPQFLLHYRKEKIAATTAILPNSPHSPRALHSCSTAPAAFNEMGHGHMITSLTPTQTPTYKRLRIRPKSTSHPGQRFSGRNDVQGPYETSTLAVPAIAEINDSPLKRKTWTRKVWDKALESPKHKANKLVQDEEPAESPVAVATHDQMAKYSSHHLPDPESRCASRMEGTLEAPTLCKSQCRVLSVSGTPVHSFSRQMLDGNKTAYEPLLRCLAMENRKAGGYFLKYLGTLQDTVYTNCLQFWREVQEYKSLFVQKSFSPCAVEMKAKALFSKYINKCSSECIKCTSQICTEISASLWPAYEDLFDLAEEHALDMLLTQWNDLCNAEDEAFQKLETVKLIESESSHLSSTSISFDSSSSTQYTGDFFTEGNSISEADSSILLSLSTASTSTAATLDMILNNAIELEHFKIFLNKHCAAEDLMCWMDIEAFRGVPLGDKYIRNMKAKQLKKQYMNKEYYFGPNSPASKENQRQTKIAGGINPGSRLPNRPRTPVFREAQKHIRARLEKKWLAQFINSPEFLERNKKPMSFGNTSAKSQQQQHVTEHTFINSHQAILFRKFLLSREKEDPYLHYLKIKAIGDTLSLGMKYPQNDLKFWYEVQKYKGMFHAHTMESMLENKATALIDCFFNSTTPPQLQIDVPLSQAENVTRKATGPYLFRETQAVIFKLLYNGWKEYKNFASGLELNQVRRTLYRLEKSIIEGLRKKKEMEERVKQEEERRRMLLPRFETIAEREVRIKREKELEEFGTAAVEFRLSSPDACNYEYYTDLPSRSQTASFMQITKMAFDGMGSPESFITPKSELLVRRDKNIEKPKEASKVERRPRSAMRASSKQQTRQVKPVPLIIDDKMPLLEMKSTDKTPPKVQRPSCPMYKQQITVQQEKMSPERMHTMKLGRLSQATLSSSKSSEPYYRESRLQQSPERMHNLKLGRLSQATLSSSKSSEPRMKKKMSMAREKLSDTSVAPNMNTIKVHISGNEGSEFMCNNAPCDVHTLTIKSQQFYDKNGHVRETLKV